MTVAPTLPSWWLDEALEARGEEPGAPALEREIDVDVAIVGGGYTGLWTALALRERNPDLGIAVLEAEIVGWGPSGRNGGFVNGYWTHVVSARSSLTDDEALALARAGEKIVPAVRELCERRGEDVWLVEAGYLKVSAAPVQDAALAKAAEGAKELGAPDQAVPLSAEEVARRIRSPRFRAGVFFPDGATVQPARLARALRRAVLDEGIALHERTRVTRLEPGSPNVLETPRGRVRARDVVVAVNAAATGWKPVARYLTNFGSYIVLTEPVPDLAERIGWTGGEAVSDGRMFIHYFRTTPDGRVAMGSGSGPIGFGGRVDGRFTGDVATARRAELGLRRFFPQLDDVKIERAWGGPIDVSADRLPFFGTVDGSRVHYGVGYTGHGAGPSWLGGQILASLALGSHDDWTALPLVGRRIKPLVPDPLKSVGGAFVRAASLAVEEAAEDGRRAPIYARATAAVPRLLGMRIGTR